MENKDILVEVESGEESVLVVKNENGLFDVLRNGVVRHPNSQMEDVVRALSFYLQGALDKSSKKYVCYSLYFLESKDFYTMVDSDDSSIKSPEEDGSVFQKFIYAKTLESALTQKDNFIRGRFLRNSPNW